MSKLKNDFEIVGIKMVIECSRKERVLNSGTLYENWTTFFVLNWNNFTSVPLRLKVWGQVIQLLSKIGFGACMKYGRKKWITSRESDLITYINLSRDGNARPGSINTGQQTSCWTVKMWRFVVDLYI